MKKPSLFYHTKKTRGGYIYHITKVDNNEPCWIGAYKDASTKLNIGKVREVLENAGKLMDLETDPLKYRIFETGGV
jgi:hypothetical protein